MLDRTISQLGQQRLAYKATTIWNAKWTVKQNSSDDRAMTLGVSLLCFVVQKNICPFLIVASRSGEARKTQPHLKRTQTLYQRLRGFDLCITIKEINQPQKSFNSEGARPLTLLRYIWHICHYTPVTDEYLYFSLINGIFHPLINSTPHTTSSI